MKNILFIVTGKSSIPVFLLIIKKLRLKSNIFVLYENQSLLDREFKEFLNLNSDIKSITLSKNNSNKDKDSKKNFLEVIKYELYKIGFLRLFLTTIIDFLKKTFFFKKIQRLRIQDLNYCKQKLDLILSQSDIAVSYTHLTLPTKA